MTNQDDLLNRFIHALCSEIDMYQARQPDNIFSSLYIGGGTPSILSTKQMDKLVQHTFSAFQFQDDFEFSIEGNPESINEEKLICYKRLGVNRISLGCQTFNDDLLKLLGRNTTKKETIQKYQLIRNTGFDNINLDFIFGLINQRFQDYADDLTQAVALQPEHFSCYSLTINRQPLARKIDRGVFQLPDEETIHDEYLWNYDYLEKNGYYFYELSNFAQSGKECRHNLFYWRQKDYLGLGPSASGTINQFRYSNIHNLKQYFNKLADKQLPIGFSETLDQQKIRDETIMLSLRTKQGLNLDSFMMFQDDKWRESFRKKLDYFISADLLYQKGNQIIATPKGLLLLNHIIVNLL